jgi:hypothetical protein
MEGATEIAVPITLTGAVWYLAYSVLILPSAGRPLTLIEVWSMLGVAVGITAWMISRQLFLARRRSPWTIVVSAVIMSLLLTWGISSRVRGAFETACKDTLVGTIVGLAPIDREDPFSTGEAIDPFHNKDAPIACKVGGVTDNPYLIGTLYRPSWDARLTVPLLGWLAFVAALSALGLRSLRIRPTQLAFNVFQLLRFAPAGGLGTAMGKPKPKAGKVVACNNATLWGETCGQIYAAEKQWYPGEWCVRCQQSFNATPRKFTFRVVSLFTSDVDVLNGIERIDTVSWPRGEPIAPDARISGQERWVVLQTIELPDVITVAQALAIIHELLPKWADVNDVRVKVAGTTAVERASRVACWIWRGALSHRLTYARPTNEAKLAIGPMRLRDVIEDASEELWLQLDVGLLPLELRTGFKKTFAEEGRAPEVQNSKFDLWLPISNPHAPKAERGLWVPRVEGDALRLWLSFDRLRDASIKGVSIPLPYLRYDKKAGGVSPQGHDAAPKPGSLDFVRYPMKQGAMEPERDRAIGASLAEWDWLEWRQIELLRQETLVLELGGT